MEARDARLLGRSGSASGPSQVSRRPIADQSQASRRPVAGQSRASRGPQSQAGRGPVAGHARGSIPWARPPDHRGGRPLAVDLSRPVTPLPPPGDATAPNPEPSPGAGARIWTPSLDHAPGPRAWDPQRGFGLGLRSRTRGAVTRSRPVGGGAPACAPRRRGRSGPRARRSSPTFSPRAARAGAGTASTGSTWPAGARPGPTRSR